MKALRLVMLLAAIPVCYLWFHHPKSASPMVAEETDQVPSELPASNGPPPTARSQYKRDMDQAHEAAKQMQAQREEADSIR